MRRLTARPALSIALAYVVFAVVYAWLGDWLLQALTTDPVQLAELHVFEDWIAAVLTAVIIFLLLRHEFARREQANTDLRVARDTLDVRVQERTAELSRANSELQAMADDAVRREQALRREREKLTGILDAIGDGVYIVDRERHIEYVNPALIADFGAVDGRMCYEYLHHRKDPCPWCQSATVLAGNTVHWEWSSDSNGKFYDIVATPVHNPDGSMSQLQILRDVTERKQVLQEREIRARELSTLLDISRAISSTLEVRPLIGVILDQLRVMIEYTGAGVFVIQDERAVLLDYRGPLPDDQVRGFRAPVERMPLYAKVLQTHEPTILPDILADTPEAKAFRAAAAKQVRETLGASRSLMGIPIILKEKVIGFLRLDHLDPDHFTQHDAQLALAIANQAASAMDNARLYEEVQETAALKERQHLARELHDSVSQALYGIALGTHAARLMVERDPARIPETLSYVLRLAETAVAEMRALIFELRPEALAEEGLNAALVKQATAMQAQHGVAIETDLGAEPQLSLHAKEALYRIAQEALHNTFKHARASKAAVRLWAQDGHIVLDVSDDGIGFDADASFPGHLGLKSMKERAERLGGNVTIDSAPGQGVRLRAILPLGV